MVELVEYVIIFGISAGIAGASLTLVDGAMPALSQMAAASKSDQVAGAARLSIVEDRDVSLLLPLQNSTVSCSGGTLAVATGGGDVRSYDLSFPCSFQFQGISGACDLVFSTQSDSLELGVTC